MRTKISKNWLGQLGAGIILGLGLTSCSGSGTPENGQTAAVNFSVQLSGSQSTAGKALATKAHESGEDGKVESMDDAGTTIELTEVRVNIREVEFYLPEGVRCEDLQFTFLDPVRCDNDDELEGEEDDDAKLLEGDGEEGSGEEGEAPDGEEPGAEDEEGDDEAGNDEGEDQDGDESDDAEDKIVVEGPFIADLINGTSTPSLTNFLIPAGIYRRIDIRLEKSSEADGLLAAGDPLLGNSLVASGHFEYQGTVHELRIQLKFNEEIRFRNDAGLELTETAANDVVVTLDETTWFRGINLTGCLDEGELTLEADGSLIIDEDGGEGECGNIEHIIKENIEASGSVDKDEPDGDNNDHDDGAADDAEEPGEGDDTEEGDDAPVV